MRAKYAYYGLVLTTISWLTLSVLAPWLPSNWLLTSVLTYAPPLLLAIPTVILLLIFLILALRMKWVYSFATMTCLSCFATIFVVGLQIPVDHGGHFADIHAMTLNVELNNRTVPGLADYIRENRIDIVYLQENKGGKQSPASVLAKAFPQWHVDTEGELAILSRWPLSERKVRKMRSLPGRIILSATVASPHPFRAMTTHWSVPQITHGLGKLTRSIEAQRYDYEDTLDELNQSSLPTILGGDFNNPPRHAFSRGLSDRMIDAYSTTGFGVGWTFPASRPITRIDHLFSSKPLVPMATIVGPSFGSDHCSLVAMFSFL